MSGPFTKNPSVGLPTWSLDATIDGNFQNIQVTGGTTVDEVGYGEGGYGIGGYDTPTINIPSTPTTAWTLETTK